LLLKFEWFFYIITLFGAIIVLPGAIIVWPGDTLAELTWNDECWGDRTLFCWFASDIIWGVWIDGLIIFWDKIDEDGLIYTDWGLILLVLAEFWFLIITEGIFEWISCWNCELFFDGLYSLNFITFFNCWGEWWTIFFWTIV
jgi:hypothetical protein